MNERPASADHLPFSLRELRCFIAVAEEGQVTTAAARLRTAQPALSQTLARLEVRVGTPLLERHARGVSLTDAGEAFCAGARAVVSAAEEALAVVGPWARGEDRLLFGLPPGAQSLARPLRREFAARHPGVALRVVELAAGERLVRLRAGRIDAELAYPPPLDARLATCTVLRAPRYGVLSERHALAGADSLRLDEFAEEVLGCDPGETAAELETHGWLARPAGVATARQGSWNPGIDELWALICAGRAAAVLPRFMLSATVGDGVRAVPLLDVAPLEVVLARRSEDARVTLGALIDAARAAAAPEEPALAGHAFAVDGAR